MKLDGSDHRIIAVLREDARTSIRDLAVKLKMRPSTVHQRILRLRREGVIEKYTLKLNNKAIGENFIVFMWVNGELADSILTDKHVKEAFGVTGEYDYVLKLKFSGVEEFNDFVVEFRKEYDFERMTTMVVTSVKKEEL